MILKGIVKSSKGTALDDKRMVTILTDEFPSYLECGETVYLRIYGIFKDPPINES